MKSHRYPVFLCPIIRTSVFYPLYCIQKKYCQVHVHGFLQIHRYFFTGFLVALIYFAPYYFHTSLRFIYVSHYITVFLLFIMYFNHIIVISFAYNLSFFLFYTKKRTIFSSFFMFAFSLTFYILLV